MKKCPKCNRTYDDSLSFCLTDGTPLTVENETETVVLQKPSSTAPRKKRLLLWFSLTALVVLAAGIGAGGLLIYRFSKAGDSSNSSGAQAKRQSVVNVSTSPTFAPRITPTPATANNSSPIENSSPKPEKSKATQPDEDADDVTPIAWETTGSGFKSDENLIYKFRCPEHGTEHTVWGSDIYTQDSSICTAAVHAGIITLADGGIVTIEFRPGRLTYGSTVRNGIKTSTYGEYPHSFVVR